MGSVLELPIDEVPEQVFPYLPVINDWLQRRFNLQFYKIPYQVFLKKFELKGAGWCFLSGKTIRSATNGNLTHMCVGKNGKLVHDPHPSRAGLTKIQFLGVLAPWRT